MPSRDNPDVTARAISPSDHAPRPVAGSEVRLRVHTTVPSGNASTSCVEPWPAPSAPSVLGAPSRVQSRWEWHIRQFATCSPR